MMPNIGWIFYIVLMSPNGSGYITVKKYDSLDTCESFLHTSYKRVRKEYPLKEYERIVGGGCKPERKEI